MLEMTEKQEFLVSCLQTALAQDPVVQPEHYGDTYSTEHVRSPGQGAFQPELLRHVSNMCDAYIYECSKLATEATVANASGICWNLRHEEVT